MNFKTICIFIIVTLPLFSLAQDTSWRTIRVNDDLVASLPGSIDSMVNVKQGPQVFTFYTGQRANNLYMIQVSAKTNLNIHDDESYEDALKGVQKGIVNSFKQKNIVPKIGDTLIQGIKMKTITTEVHDLDVGGNWHTYIFILNDRFYNIGVIHKSEEPLNGSDLQTFLNSIKFTTSIQEKEFPSKAYGIGYNMGKLLWGLIVMGVIGLIIYFIVRRI